jgi:hypothetical protein
VILFSLLIVWAADMDNDCVRVGGLRPGDIDNRSVSSLLFYECMFTIQ